MKIEFETSALEDGLFNTIEGGVTLGGKVLSVPEVIHALFKEFLLKNAKL